MWKVIGSNSTGLQIRAYHFLVSVTRNQCQNDPEMVQTDAEFELKSHSFNQFQGQADPFLGQTSVTWEFLELVEIPTSSFNISRCCNN